MKLDLCLKLFFQEKNKDFNARVLKHNIVYHQIGHKGQSRELFGAKLAQMEFESESVRH